MKTINRTFSENRKISPTSILPSHSFALYPQSSRKRDSAECLIKDTFKATYNAEVKDFLPLLIAAKNNEKLDAVIGVGGAVNAPLYLESYLNLSIETEINKHCNLTVQRKNIVEIGNLVANRGGVSRQLFIVLALALKKIGIEWVSFTATPHVELLLQKLTFEPIEICAAQEISVVNGQSNWGTYYGSVPKVCIGNVNHACERLKQAPLIKKMNAQLSPAIERLAEQLSLELSL